MNAATPSTPHPQAADAVFPLLWALAMSGHRGLPDESAARAAIRLEIVSLKQAASEHHAQLTAVSSIALGADLLFAEECLAAGLPWKCLLPFAKEEFRKDDFTAADWARVETCLSQAYRVEELIHGSPGNPDLRAAAYSDCGHRMVEQADVIMLLWDEKPAKGVDGTAEVWDYAHTLSKPVWQWNPETAVVLRARWPGDASGIWPDRKLFKSRVTPLVHDAVKLPAVPPSQPESQKKDNASTPPSKTETGLTTLFGQFDKLALQKQGDAQMLMQKVVFYHLLATTAAALSVTIVAAGCWHSLSEMRWLAIIVVLVFSGLVLAKPLLAGLALHWEKRLHQLRSHEQWVEARVATELCRSALTTWRFAEAPLNVFSEEDFPHFKRLVRTLRLARELQTPSAISSSPDQSFELYSTGRIDVQIEYFKDKHDKAVKEHDLWQRHFNVATWTVIILGGLFGIAEAFDACSSMGSEHHGHGGLFSLWLHRLAPLFAFVLIVAPFYASYALAVLSIRDCRRRCDRFARMQMFLERQKKRLSQIKSPSSRIAVVENTERMLLEELHEWYSVMRSVRV